MAAASPGKIMTRVQTFIAWSVVSLALLASANAQTADDIVNKHIDAIGGPTLLAGIRSMQIEGATTIMGLEYPYKAVIVDGKAFRSESTAAAGSALVICVTDTGGWMVNPMVGSSPEILPADQAKGLKSFIYVADPLVGYKSKGLSAELLGRASAGTGVSAYKLRLFDNSGTDTTYYIDPNSYLILRSERTGQVEGQDVDMSTSFSNFQKTPIGYTMAYQSDFDFGGNYSYTVTYSKVTFNQDVDPQMCALPK